MRFKIDVRFSVAENVTVNRVIRYFVLADLFLWGGWGFVSPVFALFVVAAIPGASAITVGIALSLYWLTKSILQVPIALYLDQRGDYFDLHALIAGLMLAGFTAMAFPLVGSAATLYALCVLQGIAFALYTPSWSAVFSRHLDKNHYAFDWSLDSTTIGLASGVAAIVGGIVAGIFGFTLAFFLTGAFSFASALILVGAPGLVLPKSPSPVTPILPDRTPGITPKTE